MPHLALAGLVCGGCGASRFTTSWQTFRDGSRHIRVDCGACHRFVRYARQTGSPAPRYRPAPDVSGEQLAAPVPEEEWHWIGLIRQADNQWRPVALAKTLPRVWDVLLHYPGDGEFLCVPTRPVSPGETVDAEAASAELCRKEPR
jgi:hypothetical protein